MIKIDTQHYIELVKSSEELADLKEQMNDIMVLYNGLLMKNGLLQIENSELLDKLSTYIHGDDHEDTI